MFCFKYVARSRLRPRWHVEERVDQNLESRFSIKYRAINLANLNNSIYGAIVLHNKLSEFDYSSFLLDSPKSMH